MLLPTKHEILKNNELVIGAKIINLLSKKTSVNITDLFEETVKIDSISLNQFYDTLTFLWLADIVILEKFKVQLLKR
ncbi:MAG: hypothetical protein PHP97_01125 [Candidatus Shapirobacteria bacterium]|jgi:hypothetical protein|nr:hypothetical protein [Candidatus Shapirobacteria bacterium]MDD4382634.1 hypothetical protein [Candidatus Shapirobacteria bacterium]